MEKNIAAFLRTNTRTILVRFFKDSYQDMKELKTLLGQDGIASPKFSERAYLYVTDMDLQVGDFVVVEALTIPKVAVVVAVHDDVQIEPEACIEYKWVVAKIDIEAHKKNTQRNEEIKTQAHRAYRKGLSDRFRELVLNSCTPIERKKLKALL